MQNDGAEVELQPMGCADDCHEQGTKLLQRDISDLGPWHVADLTKIENQVLALLQPFFGK